jgi:PKD repeat protein
LTPTQTPRPHHLRRLLVALVATAFVAAGAGATAHPAQADPPPAATPTTVSAALLPTWQINGVVWSQAVVGNTVYVTGSFTKARPPGVAAGGAGEVTANNLFAFDLTTGNRVATFDHSLDAQGLVVTASPDGSRIYVGGDFSTVDGTPRGHVAAFSTADNSLVTTWKPNVGGQVRGFGITADTVYVGGNFPSANGVAKTSLAAFAVSNGAMTPWSPTAEGDGGYVWTMTMSPDNSRVLVGGSFSTLNGAAAYGMGALDAGTGATLPWAATQRIKSAGLNGAITTLKTDGTQVYGGGYAFGAGAAFEGTFAADPNTGNILWVNDCLGDTYDTFVLNQALYSVGHVHNCTVVGGFPDTNPRSRWQKAMAAPIHPTGTITQKDAYGWDFTGLPYAGVLHWFPDLDFGSYTADRQAAWSVSGSGDYLVLAGEFPTVNGVAQQGLARFANRGVAGPSQKPIYNAAMTPAATSTESGTARIKWNSTWDRDDKTLTYDVYRDGGPSIGTLTQDSNFWTLPSMGFLDTGQAPGSTHTYKVRVKDSDGNVQWSVASAPVTISAAAPSGYTQAVRADGASHLWKLGDTGPAFVDSAGFADGTSASTTFGAAGALSGNTGVSSNGGSSPKAYATSSEAHPTAVTVEAWVKTTTGSGGRIVGFGDSSSGTSATATNDMVLYLDNSGKVNFALNNGSWRSVTSAGSVNDGGWHHLVATADGSGVGLFVDGRRVGRDQAPVSMSSFTGYWRMLADQTSGLPNRPSNNGLSGSVDEVAVYPTALSQQKIQSHYTASGRTANWATPPTDTYGAAVVADTPDLYWRLGESSGSTAADSSTSGQNGQVGGSLTWGGAGAVTGNSAATFNGTNNVVVDTQRATNPTAYSAELWFKSTSTTGGKLIGFGNAASGNSSSYDRQVVLLSNGRLQFGANPGTRALAETTTSYNDGQWHHVVATQGADGMKLYVDSVLRATNAATGAQNFTGYWRVGGDPTWGGTSTNYVKATIDEVAVYASTLSADAVDRHYAASGRQLPNKLPTAAFTHTESYLDLTADASSSSDKDGTITSYAWNFGDGTSGTGVNPHHSYAAAGTYTVTLTVTDDRGGTATTSQPVAVVANQPPTASFTHTESFLDLSVNGSGSTDTDGQITSYAWNFGDGATGTGATAQHSYAAAGTYTVTLTVTDNGSKTATSTATVTVAANQPPTASFTHTENLRTVNVDASASSDPEGTALTYAWTFGDGGTATGATASHAYVADGTYTVTLTVTDANGAKGTASQQVTVAGPFNAPPTASFTHTEAFLKADLDGRGSSDADGTIVSYAWNFGDGSTGTGSTASHTYAAAGTYPVALTVTDDGGKTATTTVSITVAANPAYAQDDFTRIVASGWGTADIGGAWTVSGTASRYSVGGGVAKVNLAAGSSSTTTLPSVSNTSTEVAVLASTDVVPTGGGQYFSVLGRMTGATTDYRAKVRMAAGGAVTLYLARTENAVETILTTTTVAGLTYNPGDKLRVRLQVTGTSPTTLQAKVWKDGTTEPAAWQGTVTDSTASLQAAGYVGLYSYLSASTTNGPVAYSYDQLWVGPVRP